MINKNLLVCTFVFALLSNSLFSQQWVEEMQSPNANLYQIQNSFEQYWQNKDITEKGKGYKAFKRWEHFAAPRVYPTGDISQLQLTVPNYETFLKSYYSDPVQSNGKLLGNSALIASSTWTPMGPFGALSGSAGSQFLKSGRLGFITINPTNTLNLWVGAPAGGLWMSNNGGGSWSTNTDQLGVIGCSDLVIDPTNTLVMYMATGDGDAGDTRSIGVLKSTNGGATWNTTGLSNPVTTYFIIRKLLINPSNTQIVLAATNNGIYRTTNGGTSWSNVSNVSTYDLEFKPGDPNTVYAGGSTFRLSTNAGASFTQITSGLGSTGFQRIAIAVTPADVNYVYLLGSDGNNSGFQGLYRSINSGVGFAAMSTSANINVLGWNTTGTDVGGQGWYDLCIAASPLNKDEIVVGGVNVWRSLDGGTNWSIYGHWTGSGGAPFTHADHHDLEYAANGTLFDCNDGTVYQRTGSTWTEIAGLMNISQIYRIGLSGMTANKWITGHQDNGTSTWNGTTYSARIGGDGMDCFYDRTNDQNVFGSTQNGGFQRSTNGGTNWSGCTTGLTGTAPWLTIWKQDPQNSSTLYCGRQNLFRSTNLAATAWSTLTPVPTTNGIIEFAIAPSNNQVIYVLKSSGIYKTTDGAVTWSTVTNGVPVASASPERIIIDPTDPNNAWVMLSGYSAGNKVFMTTNGGSTWSNWSANLPNIPANCGVYQPGSNDMIYVGMDVGVYFRDAGATQWTLYNTGLPNVPISDLEISAVNNGIIHAATYGRGVWAVSQYAPTGAPLSMFAFPSNLKCVGASITFSDQSSNSPSSWSWSVVPSTGVVITSPTSQNPTITFPSAGTYTVNMQATNTIGQGTVNTQVITVSNPPVVNIANQTASVCLGQSVSLLASGATSYTWSNGGGTANTATFYPSAFSVYSVAAMANSCTVVKSITVSANPLPQIAINAPANVCVGDTVVLTGNGALSYTWNTGYVGSSITSTLAATSNFSITGKDINGCSNVAFALIGVFPNPTVSVLATTTVICLNEEVILSASGALNYLWMPGGQTGSTLAAMPQTNTTFTCTGADNNGCDQETYLAVEVSICENISKNGAINNKISIFPNPAKNKLSIRSSDTGADHMKVEILDASGKVVLSQQLAFHSGLAEVNISTLPNGHYILNVTEGNGAQQSFRLIKD